MIKKLLLLTAVTFAAINFSYAQGTDELYEDVKFRNKDTTRFFTSEKVDFLRIPSSVTPGTEFAISVYKPEKPSPVMMTTHGWHMSIKPPVANEENPFPGFLSVQVDMRGREYSTGKQDCNGLELYDIYDAYRYVLKNYKQYISDPEQVYYTGGSGAGANGYAMIGKFPDLYCSAYIECGTSDFARWFREDTELEEFRDEMIPWIGGTPDEKPEAYLSRSGLTVLENVLTPVYICHGAADPRVPIIQAHLYVDKAKKLGKKCEYLELTGVGTREHWGNITPEQEKMKEDIARRGQSPHPTVKLPEKGRLIVAGYVITKHFTVWMDSIDSVGEISYDLQKKKVRFLKGTGEVVWSKQ